MDCRDDVGALSAKLDEFRDPVPSKGCSSKRFPPLILMLQHFEIYVFTGDVKKVAAVMSEYFSSYQDNDSTDVFMASTTRLYSDLRDIIGREAFDRISRLLRDGHMTMALGLAPSFDLRDRNCPNCSGRRVLHLFCPECGTLFDIKEELCCEMNLTAKVTAKATKVSSSDNCTKNARNAKKRYRGRNANMTEEEREIDAEQKTAAKVKRRVNSAGMAGIKRLFRSAWRPRVFGTTGGDVLFLMTNLSLVVTGEQRDFAVSCSKELCVRWVREKQIQLETPGDEDEDEKRRETRIDHVIKDAAEGLYAITRMLRGGSKERGMFFADPLFFTQPECPSSSSSQCKSSSNTNRNGNNRSKNGNSRNRNGNSNGLQRQRIDRAVKANNKTDEKNPASTGQYDNNKTKEYDDADNWMDEYNAEDYEDNEDNEDNEGGQDDAQQSFSHSAGNKARNGMGKGDSNDSRHGFSTLIVSKQIMNVIECKVPDDVDYNYWDGVMQKELDREWYSHVNIRQNIDHDIDYNTDYGINHYGVCESKVDEENEDNYGYDISHVNGEGMLSGNRQMGRSLELIRQYPLIVPSSSSAFTSYPSAPFSSSSSSSSSSFSHCHASTFQSSFPPSASSHPSLPSFPISSSFQPLSHAPLPLKSCLKPSRFTPLDHVNHDALNYTTNNPNYAVNKGTNNSVGNGENKEHEENVGKSPIVSVSSSRTSNDDENLGDLPLNLPVNLLVSRDESSSGSNRNSDEDNDSDYNGDDNGDNDNSEDGDDNEEKREKRGRGGQDGKAPSRSRPGYIPPNIDDKRGQKNKNGEKDGRDGRDRNGSKHRKNGSSRANSFNNNDDDGNGNMDCMDDRDDIDKLNAPPLTECLIPSIPPTSSVPPTHSTPRPPPIPEPPPLLQQAKQNISSILTRYLKSFLPDLIDYIPTPRDPKNGGKKGRKPPDLPISKISYCTNCRRTDHNKKPNCSDCGESITDHWDYSSITDTLLWSFIFSMIQIEGSEPYQLCCKNIIQLLPIVRCYKTKEELGPELFKMECYCCTHIIYMFSDYGHHALNRQIFAEEFRLIVENIEYVCAEMGDIEIVGEFIQCLKILQYTEESDPELEPLMRGAVEYLLKREKDGIWSTSEKTVKPKLGDINEYDYAYRQYHTSYCAAIGILDFGFLQNREDRLNPPTPSVLKLCDSYA